VAHDLLEVLVLQLLHKVQVMQVEQLHLYHQDDEVHLLLGQMVLVVLDEMDEIEHLILYLEVPLLMLVEVVEDILIVELVVQDEVVMVKHIIQEMVVQVQQIQVEVVVEYHEQVQHLGMIDEVVLSLFHTLLIEAIEYLLHLLVVLLQQVVDKLFIHLHQVVL